MAQSFMIDPSAEDRGNHSPMRRVLVTGAAGNIGAYFAQHAHAKFALRLMVRPCDNADALKGKGEIVTGDLSDLPRLRELCEGIDTVLHLAANPSPTAVWSDLLTNNIEGTYHMMVAARAAGVRRVIYASSIHAISGYPADVQVKSSDPVNPGDLYGVTKCFGEALGRYMAACEGLSVIAVRIGAFQPLEAAQNPEGLKMVDAFVSERDLQQLLERCIEAPPSLRFAIVHGLSNNRFKRMDITEAKELLGYEPIDDLTEENPKLKDLALDDISTHSGTIDEAQSGLREDLAALAQDPKA